MVTNPPIQSHLTAREIASSLAKETVTLPNETKYLAFAGGGATAFAELGVYNALYDNDKLGALEEVAGTSAGSMMAGLVALGYHGDEFIPLTVDQDFSILTSLEGTSEKLALLPNLLGKKSGIFTGDSIGKWMEHAITKRIGHPEMTFEELHQWREEAKKSIETGDLSFFETKAREAFPREKIYANRYEQFHNIKAANGSPAPFKVDFDTAEQLRDNVLKMKDLHVVASKVIEVDGEKTYEKVVFNHKNEAYKSVPIAQAIEASASFPFVFAQECINGELFTDGGLVNNIPIEIFDGSYGEVNPHALAISVNYVPTEGNVKESTQDAFVKLVNLRNKIPGLPDWDVEAARKIFRVHMQEELNDKRDTDRTIAVNVPDVDYTDFGISRELKLQTQNVGYARGMEVITANKTQYHTNYIQNSTSPLKKFSWVSTVTEPPNFTSSQSTTFQR